MRKKIETIDFTLDLHQVSKHPRCDFLLTSNPLHTSEEITNEFTTEEIRNLNNPNVIHNPNENARHKTQISKEKARPKEQSSRAFYHILFEELHIFPHLGQKKEP